MRDIKTLIQIVIDSLKEGSKTNFYNSGICGEINDLEHNKIINHYEKFILIDTLYDNKPSADNEFKLFINSEYWVGLLHWWCNMTTYPDTRQIRIDYLTQLKESL